jgi:hypothetical protein
MRETPRSAGYSRTASLVLFAGLLVLLAGGVAVAQVYWPVYASSGDNGSISPAGTVYVPDGGSAAFSFIPNPGYMVYQVIVDGTVVAGNVPGYTLEGVQGQHSIQVLFAPVPGAEEYAPEWVAPVPGPYIFGGGFDQRREAQEFSRRGFESRREVHPEIGGPARPGGPRGGMPPGGGPPGGGPRGGMPPGGGPPGGGPPGGGAGGRR